MPLRATSSPPASGQVATARESVVCRTGRDWVILEVRLTELEDARLYKDIWSKSGVILDKVRAIPSHLLEMVWG